MGSGGARRGRAPAEKMGGLRSVMAAHPTVPRVGPGEVGTPGDETQSSGGPEGGPLRTSPASMPEADCRPSTPAARSPFRRYATCPLVSPIRPASNRQEAAMPAVARNDPRCDRPRRVEGEGPARPRAALPRIRAARSRIFHDLDPLSELVSSLLSHRTRNADSGRAFKAAAGPVRRLGRRPRRARRPRSRTPIAPCTWPEQKAPPAPGGAPRDHRAAGRAVARLPRRDARARGPRLARRDPRHRPEDQRRGPPVQQPAHARPARGQPSPPRRRRGSA